MITKEQVIDQIEFILSTFWNEAKQLSDFMIQHRKSVKLKDYWDMDIAIADYKTKYPGTNEGVLLEARRYIVKLSKLTPYEAPLSSMFIGEDSRLPPIAEVYGVFVDDSCVYIGAGQLNRHLHCNSGISNNYNLNKLHFSGKEMQVAVLREFKTREDAFFVEKQLIAKFKPAYNKEFVVRDTIF